MMSFRFSFFSLLALFVLIMSGQAFAQPSPGTLPQHVTRPLLSSPIAAQLQTLMNGPAPEATTPAPTPTTAAPGESSDTVEPAEVEPQETFGTKALNMLITESEMLGSQGTHIFDNIAALPQLTAWLNFQSTDPKARDRWAQTGNNVLYVIGLSFVAAFGLDFLLLPFRNRLRRDIPNKFSRKIGILLIFIFLRLIPVIAFLGLSLFFLDQQEPQKFARFIVLNIVYALAISRVVLIMFNGFLAPRTGSLRLIHASDYQAKYASLWLTAYSLIIVYGYFLIDVARAIRVPPSAIASFTTLLGLVLVVMTLVVIVQKRAFVSTLLRGNLSAAQDDLSLFQSLRLWLARHWHILAIAYIIIGYLITVLGVENGFLVMLRGTILTLGIFALMRALFHLTDRWGKGTNGASNTVHHTILRTLLRLVIWIFAAIAAAAAWGANIPAFFNTPLGQRLLGSAFSIGITVVIVALIYEVCNSTIERHLNRRDAEGKALQASARVRTLLPMIRNTIFIGFSLVVGLVVMSEAGFNVAPLLAGAGIFGVALGFGSQTLVKDFLTGLFIVVENTIAIGDVVKLGVHSGTVEAMSMRTLRLRDVDGSLHIVPFSEVSNIINMTKDFSYALIDIGVAYNSDLEHVMNIMRAVGNDLQQDAIFKRVILEPIEVMGVEKLGDSSITLRARIRTRPGKQWDVRRQMLLKIKQRFDAEGIEIPYPTVTNIQKSLPPA